MRLSVLVPRPIKRLWRSSAVRYLFVGGLAFVFDFALLLLLHDIAHVELVAATPIAFLTSFALTFVMQRTITFKTGAGWGASAVKYTALVLFNTFATTMIVTGIDALGWHWAAGKAVAVASTTVWNYFGYRYWIFPSTREAD